MISENMGNDISQDDPTQNKKEESSLMIKKVITIIALEETVIGQKYDNKLR